MATFREFVIDRWSALSHKAPMRDDAASRIQSSIKGWAPAGWIGDEHRRRLQAYVVLASYDENVSRHFLEGSDQDRGDNREYGDPGLVIDTTLSALLGDDQAIVVPGAEHYDAELDDPAEQTDDDGNPVDPDPADVAAYAVNAAARVLAERQEFLQAWAQDVHLPLRMVDGERNAVALGDGVYLLGWDDARARPTCAVMDPGFYFPVLPDTLDTYEYPERVHFAWEIPGDDFPDGKQRVRRITYELTTMTPVYDEEGAYVAGLDPAYGGDFEEFYSLPEDSEWFVDDEGFRQVGRRYPWSDAGDPPSTITCTVTDATWTLDALNDAQNVDAFTLESADIRTEDGVEVRDLDLGVDFLPVVHIPNTPAGGDHYGASSLTRVLQVFDDLQAADTDAQRASATTGSPIIGISGSATTGDDPLTGRRGKPLIVGPGEVWKLGTDGRMDTVDTSPNLAATREYVLALRDRLLVNARLPAAVVGTLKPSEVPSGYAMQLSFGPLSGMVRTMRLVRGVKYPLMLKMVQRLYQANGVLPPGKTPRAEIQLGSFLPADQSGMLTTVSTAYTARLISLETAVTMLLEVGFPVDDVAEEIERIQSRDYEAANALADATGDQEAVREFLGLDPAPAVVPPVVLPPAPPAPVPPVVP